MHTRKRERGFTLIELMIVVAITGILAALGIPTLTSYMNQSRAAEANIAVSHIYDSVRLYRIDNNNHQFPDSAPPTPAGGCCTLTGNKCTPDRTYWAHPTWTAVEFYMKTAHYYQYEIVSDNTSNPATFTVYAYGDLDCDGITSTYQRRGVYDNGKINEIQLVPKIRPYE